MAEYIYWQSIAQTVSTFIGGLLALVTFEILNAFVFPKVREFLTEGERNV